jgi:hypothetical protein
LLLSPTSPQSKTPDGPALTNVVRTLRAREPGSGLVSAGMVLLGLLDAGLLYVVFDAQDRFIFSVKQQGPAAMIQALALDLAMIIFSVLGLGLARRGLAANSERACIVVCALASAFMNWTASNQASVRSVAVYVSAPVLLALVTDRTISVVRRHVLGMREDDHSVWARLGHGLGRAALYALRLVVDFRATWRGVRRAILRAAPLPEPEEPERAAGAEVLDLAAVRAELAQAVESIRRAAEADVTELAARLGRLELEAAAGGNADVYPSKKAHLLALYRQHPEYGRRAVASRVAGELAEAAGLQPGTARAYVYEELARQRGDALAPGRGWGPAGGDRMRAARVLLMLPVHHLYLDTLAVFVLAGLFWRFNLSHWAMAANRARAMRWRTRCRLRPGPGFATLAELAVQWSRLAAVRRGGRARPGLTFGQRLLVVPATGYALRLGGPSGASGCSGRWRPTGC